MAADRPIYVGNYEYSMEEVEIRRLFDDFGDVNRIDMKTGFCFVYMASERDAERAIRKLDNRECGYKRRPLRVQWAKTKDADRRREARPSTTLFVVNFDLARVRERDIERHFEVCGPIKRVEIKKSYAFVQFESLDDAEYALKKFNGTQMEGRTITVEYVQNENPNNAGGFRERGGFEGRGRSRSPVRRRSLSPPRRGSPPPRRGSPPMRGSPVRRRGSPPMRRASPPSRGASPPPRGESPPVRRGSRSLSPRSRSPVGRSRSRSPVGRDRSP